MINTEPTVQPKPVHQLTEQEKCIIAIQAGVPIVDGEALDDKIKLTTAPCSIRIENGQYVVAYRETLT